MVQDGHGRLRQISIEIVKVGNIMPNVEFIERKLGFQCLKVLSRELPIETLDKGRKWWKWKERGCMKDEVGDGNYPFKGMIRG